MDKLLPMYSMPHLKAQDFMHREFFQRFIEWSRDAVDIVAEDYPYQYPTSGSSEAIRETIAQHGNQARARNESPRIHIFEGEYEGYIAYAKAHEVEVVVHNRQSYDYSMQDSFTHGDKFYMSTPSGIDGNIWDGYEKFLQYLEEHDLNSSLMIDLAYLNTTVETPEIRTQSSAIEAIFFSMSKSFPGTYYDRIGGVFSKSPIPGLYGNKWFKNLA